MTEVPGQNTRPQKKGGVGEGLESVNPGVTPPPTSFD